MTNVPLCYCGCGEPALFAARHVHYRLKSKEKFGQWEPRDMGFATVCHFWIGALSTGRERAGRYGRIYLRGKYRGAHRAIYEEKIGPVPPGKHLHHLCGVTRCVNPEHLIPVTPSEHSRYSISLKLDDESVRWIRRTSVGAIDAARILKVSESLIYQVRAGTIWTHVT